jgi:hypothetical protein
VGVWSPNRLDFPQYTPPAVTRKPKNRKTCEYRPAVGLPVQNPRCERLLQRFCISAVGAACRGGGGSLSQPVAMALDEAMHRVRRPTPSGTKDLQIAAIMPEAVVPVVSNTTHGRRGR